MAGAQHALSGGVENGGEELFYLGGQAALAIPGEDRDMALHCSTQHRSEIQHKVADCLGLPNHAVTVETRRMGGAFRRGLLIGSGGPQGGGTKRQQKTPTSRSGPASICIELIFTSNTWFEIGP